MITGGDHTRIRVANENDADEIMEMAREIHGENGVFRLSEEKIRTLLDGALSGPVETRRGVCGVIGASGTVESSIFLEFGVPYYSEDVGVFELWNYVRPEYRRTNNCNDQIAWARYVRAQFDLPLVIGCLSNQRTQAKIRLYSRQLGPPAGAFFIEGAVTGRGKVNVQ